MTNGGNISSNKFKKSFNLEFEDLKVIEIFNKVITKEKGEKFFGSMYWIMNYININKPNGGYDIKTQKEYSKQVFQKLK